MSGNITTLQEKKLKLLALELWANGICPPDKNKKICSKFYTSSQSGCIDCWIAWTKRQVNGT